MVDLLHPLHPDLEIQGYTISLAKAVRTRGIRPWLGHLQGWLATASPPVGAAGHGLATCKGAAGSVARGNSYLQHDARKGGRLQGARNEQPSVTSPQGVVASDQHARGGPRAVTCRGNSADRRSSCRWARATTAYAVPQRGQEGLGQSFYKKDDLAPLNSENTKDCHRV
ncbi:hypothetical protein B296_00033603 [Ensete ventricosum]|uniref:Uncharacterized protein n=1 Tax=Ensete ventricosum TaxID=4639 RepID=A0A426XCV9_ENSVE|nr:hypothetical protein B296_00033603 [Ensete ventricosum]